ncbi:LacI family DNA-binding transcriptional regulator [Oceanobacillus timonensis]|uniref:LacI family DNA-binding transcriptional regulator n=1 Tax=Oceanobacillus timonensis TaxID=1926285 RepID=UPI0009BBE6C7|nr:LacI family DNA-binding transcriptional regulator [Oceanobacillus timonensis]
MRISIKDVAKAAGVAQSTVSKVINNTGSISKETIDRVNYHIQELGYEPSGIASALRNNKTKAIGLLIPDLANPFFSDLARLLEDEANHLGYRLSISSTDYIKEKELSYLKMFLKNNVDGIIIASGMEEIDDIKKVVAGKPIVGITREFPSQNISSISVNNYYGGYKAANYLIDHHHKNLAIIAKPVWGNKERVRGCQQAVIDAGLPEMNSRNTLFVETTSTFKEQHWHIKQLLQETPSPTAIIACNNLFAAKTIQLAKQERLSVPKDISIIGFDDTVLAQLMDPPLTTIRQPLQTMAKETIKLLDQKIHSKTSELQLRLELELIERDSVAPIY